MAVEGIKINTAPWSLFLPKLKALGVEIKTTESGSPWLCRKVDGKIFYDTLPTDYDQDGAIVGCFKFDAVCKNLAIDRNVHFEGWYMML